MEKRGRGKGGKEMGGRMSEEGRGGGKEGERKENGGSCNKDTNWTNFSGSIACGYGRNAHGWFCGQGILCRQRMYPSVVVTL